jgi:hypothetical protein
MFGDFLVFTSAKGNSVRCEYGNTIEQKSDIRNNGTRRSNYQTVINSIDRVSLLREEFFLLLFKKGGSTWGNKGDRLSHRLLTSEEDLLKGLSNDIFKGVFGPENKSSTL